MMYIFKSSVVTKVVLLIVVLVTTVSVNAQYVYWQMPPRSFSSLERMGHGMYKVEQAGKIGVINGSGNIIMPIEFDGIESFYEDCAIVVNKEGQCELIVGVMTGDGRFIRFPKKYYAIPNQKFFSDGLLTVSDEKKRLGYIDVDGNEVLGFSKGYTKIKPFTEGYAAVFRGNNGYQLISQSGTPCRIILGLGEIYGGTNVCNGKAVVWDSDGIVYEYFPAAGNSKKIGKLKSKTLDYLYCLTSISGRTKQIPYQISDKGKEGISPIMENGKYGFSYEGHVLISPQFNTATPFIDDISVVSINGQYGLLKYSNTGSAFSIIAEKKYYEYAPGTDVTCKFHLNVPKEWSGSGFEVLIKERETGRILSTVRRGGDYSFKCMPQNGSQTYDIDVTSGGLSLWSGSETYTFKKVNPMKSLVVSVSVKNDKADVKDQCWVVGSVHNPNSQSITVTIKMRGSTSFAEKTETVTIPAGGIHKITSYFTVKKILQNQSVSITTSKGGNATKTGLDLIPFYTGG